MSRIIVAKTDDGSNTLYSEDYKAHYHSLNGALQESQHIFIKNGFNHFSQKDLSILEVGFGTGLNAALTASSAELGGIKTKYTGVELHPLSDDILRQLNYRTILSAAEFNLWCSLNAVKWGLENQISNNFSIIKINNDISKIDFKETFDLIYYDAFAPEDQPNMWSVDLFERIYSVTNKNGILVTYCSKGIVKRALREVGFKVERLQGPIGKRHIIRAIKV